MFTLSFFILVFFGGAFSTPSKLIEVAKERVFSFAASFHRINRYLIFSVSSFNRGDDINSGIQFFVFHSFFIFSFFPFVGSFLYFVASFSCPQECFNRNVRVFLFSYTTSSSFCRYDIYKFKKGVCRLCDFIGFFHVLYTDRVKIDDGQLILIWCTWFLVFSLNSCFDNRKFYPQAICVLLTQ